METLNNEEDVRQYLLSARELRNLVQKKFDPQITVDQVNNARIKNQLNLSYKNDITSQNLIEVFF